MQLKFGVKDGNYAKEGASVKDVALWNEYGTEKTPPRPAFRMGAEYALEANRKMIGAQLQNIVRRGLQGRATEAERSFKVLFTAIGNSAVSKTKELISSGSVPPPNAPATVAKKGFDRPLFETGLLSKSVAYEVIE